MAMKPKASAVADAIARHKTAQVAYDAASAASAASPDDMHADDIAGDLCKAESGACAELAKAPCASDAECIEKLRYLVAREIRLFGSPFDSSAKLVSVTRAVEMHFGAALRMSLPESSSPASSSASSLRKNREI